MGRHADSRRSRRSRLLLAAVLVPVVAISSAFGLMALDGPALPPTVAGAGGSVENSVTASSSLAESSSGAPVQSAPSLAPSLTASPSPSPLAPTPTPTPRPASEPSTHPSFAGPRAIDVRARLQLELDRLRKRLRVPGISVTIIFGDGSSWTGTSGRANVAGKVAVTRETAFAVGSVSKTYTAALILDLARDGRVNLDTSARAYIPEARISKQITVRQLLNHTSGLDDYFLHPPIDKALQGDRAAVWSTARTLKYVRKPYFPPGRGWHYSNTNYLYLGLIAERVTGSTLADALRTHFFDENQLDDTWYQAVDEPRADVAHGYRFAGPKTTRGIDLSDGSSVMPFTSVVTAAAGAGSVAATSRDAARWARLLYTGQLLGPEMTAEMLEGVAATAGYKPRVPYGLGVQAFPIGGRPAVGHSGRLLGFRAAVRHLPAEATTIAVLTNQSRADPGIVVERLLRIVFAPPAPCNRCGDPS